MEQYKKNRVKSGTYYNYKKYFDSMIKGRLGDKKNSDIRGEHIQRFYNELEKEGYDQSRIAKRTGLQPFVVRNYSSYGRRYREEELEAIVQECVDTEEKVKTGRITDTLSVELLLIKFSS